MGNFISEAWDDFTGKSAADAAKDAASVQAAASQQGLEELRRQFDIGQGNIAPWIQAGQGALPFLQQSATPQGLDEILSQIMGTGMFGDLLDERTRSVEGLLGAGGLTRSGAAIEEGARLPTDLALTISQILTGNAGALSTSGQNAAVGAGTAGANFGANTANLLGQQGNAVASGIFGQQQAGAQGTDNLIKVLKLFAPQLAGLGVTGSSSFTSVS